MTESTNQESPRVADQARLSAYATAALATAFAGHASAGIVYSGPVNAAVPGAGESIDLNGDTFPDITFSNSGPYQGAFLPYFGSNVAGFFANGLGYASALTAGDYIDPGTLGGNPYVASLAFGATNPNAAFNNANGAFIGLRFAAGGDSLAGWVRVNIDNAMGTFTVVDWAYNDEPGQAIEAGQIPEPGSLALLAAGAAGLVARRRKTA